MCNILIDNDVRKPKLEAQQGINILTSTINVCCAALLLGTVSRLVVFTTAAVVWFPDCSAVTGRAALNGLSAVSVPMEQLIFPFAAEQPTAGQQNKQ
jgi:hypothetical protein